MRRSGAIGRGTCAGRVGRAATGETAHLFRVSRQLPRNARYMWIMARAIAGATISFGLVSIPVRLYSATQRAAGISFHLLHKKDGGRLHQQYLCDKDGEVVPREEMIKGYEFAKDQYVTFSPEELKAMQEKSTQTIDIAQFVPLDRVDPVYFDRPYYLAPDKGGEKAYRLLVEVMESSGRAAVGRYAARDRLYLVLLRPAAGAQGGGHGMVMQQLLFSDEVRPFSEVPVPEGRVTEAEVKLAKQLVDQIASDSFDASAFRNEVRDRVQAEIQRKLEGKEIAVSPPAEQPARIIDLMEALRASLGARGEGGPAPSEGARERKPPRSAPRHRPGARARAKG
jgi:DNA end-binding protein Ku